MTSEWFTDRVSLAQTTNSQGSVKQFCVRDFFFFSFFFLPKPVKHDPCPAADFNPIISYLSKNVPTSLIQLRVHKYHAWIQSWQPVMLSTRMCYQCYTTDKFRVRGYFLFQFCVGNQHYDWYDKWNLSKWLQSAV